MSRPDRDQILSRPGETAVIARRPSHFTSAVQLLASGGSWRAGVASIGAVNGGSPLAFPGIDPPSLNSRAQGAVRLSSLGGSDLTVPTRRRTRSRCGA